MYGLPDDLDLGFLIGLTLEQACFGSSFTILRFHNGDYIGFSCDFRTRQPNGDDAFFGDDALLNHAPSVAASLVPFLADSITEVQGQRDGTLRMSFAKGGVIEFYDSSEYYESYEIHHGKEIYVV